MGRSTRPKLSFSWLKLLLEKLFELDGRLLLFIEFKLEPEIEDPPVGNKFWFDVLLGKVDDGFEVEPLPCVVAKELLLKVPANKLVAVFAPGVLEKELAGVLVNELPCALLAILGEEEVELLLKELAGVLVTELELAEKGELNDWVLEMDGLDEAALKELEFKFWLKLEPVLVII